MAMGRMNTFVLVLVLATMLIEKSLAAQHVVGGDQGWDESTDFNSWASEQTFNSGDQLVFKYASGLHSVVELANESAYKNCDIGTAVDSVNSGSDVVKLNKPGTRYFACGTLGHCDQGMKVKITTVAGNAPSTPSNPSSSSSNSPSSDVSASGQSLISIVLLIVALLATVSLLSMY